MRARLLLTTLVVVLAVTACSYETPALTPVIPEDAESSSVVDADGAALFTFHGVENRESVPLSAMPDDLIDSVLAVEDSRFWSHRGVDVRATMRALRANVGEGEIVQGGSTITQQYVKNALLGSDRTLDRKVREAAVAFQIERAMTKEEILELYLNTIYFGAGAYGVQAASREFFGIDVGDLDLGQAALLAGLIQAPSTYDPYGDSALAAERRSIVLDRLVALGWREQAEIDRVRAEPVVLRTRTTVDRYDAPYFVEEVKRFILDDPRFGETREERIDLLFTGGLTIETTLDPQMQAAAERAVRQVLIGPDDPDAAVVVIDPSTGWVRAIVGGRDFFDDTDPVAKLNLATQGRRPTGSAFKPIVLAAALEEGIDLSSTWTAPPTITIDLPSGPWKVDNYADSDGGTVSLLDATVFSYNTAYAQLVMDVGPTDATTMAARLGITSPLLAVPSAVLGTNDVSPLEMTSAYATFAAGGVYRPPTFVTRVAAADGTVLYTWDDEPESALSPQTAAAVTDSLLQVVGRGTGANARIGRPVAGKTGTGQNWGDAWFVGYTPELVAGVWVGFAEAQISMVPPTTRETVTGGGWPALVWSALMTDVLAEVPIGQFPEYVPIDASDRAVDADDGTIDEELSGEERPGDEGPEEGVPDVPVDRNRAVPDVIGVPVAPATDTLLRSGLVVERLDVPDDQYPPGIVIATEPAPGAARPEDGVVVIRVANGERVLRAPDVLGRVLADVEGRMAQLGYTVEVVVEADDDAATLGPGVIWKVDPSAGTPLADDDVVTVWVTPAG